MSKQKLVIFGNRQIAEVAQFYFTHDSHYEVAAFTVDAEYVDEADFCGKPVIAFEELERDFPPAEYEMFVAISYQGVNRLRAAKFEAAKSRGYRLATFVSSRAVTWPGRVLGENCFILENNVIQPFVTIGHDTFLWSGNHIGHHSVIGDHVFIASHVVVSGNCRIEPYSFLGVNVTLRDGLTIGAAAVLGAGALILKNVPEGSVYPGTASQPIALRSDQLRKI